MKYFLVLLLYLMAPIASIHTFLENVAPHPWLFTTQMQRLQPKRLTNFPRTVHRQDIPKFMYWKHLLELECFKEICGYVHYKDRSSHHNPFEMMRHKQMPAFRNDGNSHRDQMQNFYKMRENHIRPRPEVKKKYGGNERIILWPPEANFTQKQANAPPSQRPKLEKFQGNSKGTALVKDYVNQRKGHRFPGEFNGRPAEGEENLNVFEEEDDLKRMDPEDAFSKLFQKPGFMRPSFAPSTAKSSENVPQSFRHPNKIQPYEVEEIVEEKFQVHVNDDNEEEEEGEEEEKEEDTFGTFAGKKVFGKENEVKKLDVNKKGDDFESVIDDSVNTILKGLINPVVKTSSDDDNTESVFPLENRPLRNEANSSISSFAFRTSSSSLGRHPLLEKINENPFRSPWNRQETYSRLEKIQPTLPPSDRYHGWRKKTAEASQKPDRKFLKPENPGLDSSRGFDFTPSSKKDFLNTFLTTDSPRRPPITETHHPPSDHLFNTDDPRRSQTAEDSAEDLMPYPKNPLHLSPADTLKSLDLIRDLFADHRPNFPSAEDVNESPTTQRMAEIHSTKPSTFMPETTSELFTTKSSFEGRDAVFTDQDQPLTTQGFLKTVKHFSKTDRGGGEITERDFLEFTDHPVSFDLLGATVKSDSKKDQETLWKNSRKMHFGQESPETTVSNRISDGDGNGQRRSDILITEDLADYADDENNLSTLSYIQKLKQNHSLPSSPDPRNFTTDALFPLLPVIINDLRQGKIPLEDYSILSQALGKYWNPILALSNLTNLDMLPLLKMKDEKDLENVLRNFLPEDFTTAGTTDTTEKDYNNEDDYSQSYDYMDDYKELYKDILGQEFGDKRRRFRPRRDAQDDLKTLEATREYFESIEEERNDDGSDYIFEDIVYDEVSDGEDSSVFELMEVADVVVDKET